MAGTRGISGKQGKIVLNTGTLRLTAWSMPTRVGSIDITNGESPPTTLNGVSLVSGEYIPNVFDADITFEGVFTLLENDGITNTGLFGGTKNIAPGFGSLPAAGMGAYAATLTPDRSVVADTITGNILIENLEFGGKVREGVMYKGSGKFTGGVTFAANL
jgi:hypothetical protein